MRRHKTLKLEFDIPKNIKYYGDVYSLYPPETDQEIYNAILKKMGQEYCTKHNLSPDLPRSKLWRYGSLLVDSYQKSLDEFNQFANANPWLKEFYEFCVDRGIHIRQDDNWNYVSKVKAGDDYYRYRNNFCFENFSIAFSDKHLAIFNELKRKVPFVAGNIVVLREKFLKSEGHDPFIGKQGLQNVERIGTVINVTDSIHRWSYGGKGSRLVNVLWSATGETTTASINSLRLLERKDKVVDKLVER